MSILSLQVARRYRTTRRLTLTSPLVWPAKKVKMFPLPISRNFFYTSGRTLWPPSYRCGALCILTPTLSEAALMSSHAPTTLSLGWYCSLLGPLLTLKHPTRAAVLMIPSYRLGTVVTWGLDLWSEGWRFDSERHDRSALGRGTEPPSKAPWLGLCTAHCCPLVCVLT